MKKNTFHVGRFIYIFISVASIATASTFIWINNALEANLSSLRQEYSEQTSIHESKIERLEYLLSQTGSEEGEAIATEAANVALSLQKSESPCADVDINTAENFVLNMESFHIGEAVLNKYKTLLAVVEVGAQEEQTLLELLAQRERVLNMVSHSYFTNPLDSELALEQREEKLSELDDQIATVLEPSQFDDYQLLKDSGFEQHQVEEFEGQLPADELLTEHQSNNLLLAKLKYKADYQLAIQEASRLVKSREKEKGFKLFDGAIESYKASYLNAARGELNETQFEKLKSLEEVRFAEMLMSLKAAYEGYALD